MYAWFQKSSLRFKATIVVLAIVAITLSVSSCATLLQSIRTLQGATNRAARLSAMHLAHVCTWHLQTDNNIALGNYVRQATYHEDVLFAAVYNQDRSLITFYSKDEDAWMQYLVGDQKPTDDFLLASFPIRAMILSETGAYQPTTPGMPSNSEQGPIGYVTIGYSSRAMNHAKRVQMATLFAIFMLSSSAAGWIVYLTMRSWTRRLAHLAHVSEEIANGNFDEQITETSDDEIGQLGRACEKMRRAVFERDQALRHFNDLLQDEVDQRTCELVNAKEAAEMAALNLQHTNEKLTVQVSERERSEEALRQSEERYVLAARGANDGLWDWDLTTNRVYYSVRWREIVGHPELQADESPDLWYDIVHPDDVDQLKADLAQHWDGVTEHFENEHRIRQNDDDYHWVQVRGIVERHDERPCRMAGSIRDITARKEAESRLRYQALHDDLTGLPNRTLLMDRLTGCVLRARRQKDYHFAILFMDLDRFKVVNDSLGHAAGDELLVEFSKRIESSLRRSDTLSRINQDTIARLGGDEFVLLLDPIQDAAQVCRIADRLQRILAEPFHIGGQEVFTSGSIGIAIGDSRYERAEDLLRDADMAMYRAKSSGRARYDLYDEEMHKAALTRLQVENDLRRALDGEQFAMQYQPIVDLGNGRVTGFEALVRWDHPQQGRVSPGVFIPVAEETGLIVQIGAWVLEQSCRDLKLMQDRLGPNRPITMSVNLSKRQINEPGLVEVVRNAIKKSGIEHNRLKLEITESVVMEATESLLPVLHELRALGCQLHMDDFGTGYSSLSCMHRFPLDVIKIDRAFIVNMTDDPRYAAVVNAIVTLTHNLNMKVTAEGVETRDQLAQVLSLDCDYCQGYYFAKPLNSDEALALLQEDLPWLEQLPQLEAG
ncbi:MAG TPA: hypothetical protein DCM28_11290 [Phycisphaerales bacterium]|nr:hypothetical protein [Phycisphaerales bacterium]|tara:strand:+ start:164244 stop:166907 length:2664 start_codon:yes stop_codon:yes gene_type:complete